jgi:hypothetical protein
MFRLLLFLALPALILEGDTFTFSSCNSGATVLSPCGTYLLTGGFQDAGAGASASDNSIIPGGFLNPALPAISGALTMSTGAAAFASQPGSAAAQADAYDTFETAGPVRSGFIEFDITLDQFHGGDTTITLTDGINTYSYEAAFAVGSTPPFAGACGIESCSWNAKVPFNLGTDFKVTVQSEASALPSFPGSVVHGASDGTVEFALFENLPGTLGRIPVPFSIVPEPSTSKLLLLGFGACAFLVATRSVFRSTQHVA